MRSCSVWLILLTLAALPSVGLAQHFSIGFAIGGHGRHHHHHHGHRGHDCYSSWGFDFYPPIYAYPPPVYVPPPVTYVYPAAPVVQVVQPSLTQVAAPAQSHAPAQLSSNSSVRINSLPSQQRSDVVLRNPAENAGQVAFRVQDQVDAELGPGATRTWSDRTSLTVEFDRGASFGTTRKILRPGAYEFVVTEEGWDLVATVNSPATVGRAAALQKNSLPPRR